MKAEVAGDRDRKLPFASPPRAKLIGAFRAGRAQRARRQFAHAGILAANRRFACLPERRGRQGRSLRTLPRPPLTDANLFSIPAGVPFAPTLARALLDGALIAGFPGAGGPLALADATIYVPTQRAASALAQALVAASGGASLILPRIAPLGAFEPSRDALDPLADDAFAEEEVPAAVGELARRMVLARLTRAWGQALRGAIRGVDADGLLTFDAAEPPLVATSPAQAFALAGDLAGLIDDFIIEGVDPERLDDLVADRFDPYWGVTLDFLKIAFAHWPDWLAERGLDRPRPPRRAGDRRRDSGARRRRRSAGRRSSPARPAPTAPPRG